SPDQGEVSVLVALEAEGVKPAPPRCMAAAEEMRLLHRRAVGGERLTVDADGAMHLSHRYHRDGKRRRGGHALEDTGEIGDGLGVRLPAQLPLHMPPVRVIDGPVTAVAGERGAVDLDAGPDRPPQIGR